MNLADVRAQLEADITWRLNEIRFLRNHMTTLPDDADRDRYRRVLVVMLYAHYEGFCRTALAVYAGALSEEGLQCSDVTDRIAAAALADVFSAYDNPNQKCEAFKNVLPDDSQLHRFARQANLISALATIQHRQVSIPVDTVVDTQASLRPITLRAMLFRLGLPDKQFIQYDGQIHRLVQTRHEIAHGARKDGVNHKTYSEIETAARDIMQGLTVFIMQALKERTYLRT